MTRMDAEREITRQLEPGERLLWSGSPREGLVLRPSDAFLIPFSLMWGGFAIVWEFMAFRSGAPFFFPLWGVPFVLVGLYLIVGRFFVDAAMRSRTAYGLTDRRILIIAGLFSRSIKSVALKTLTDITLTERRDRSGTISFGPLSSVARFYGGSWPGASATLPPCFELIPGAKEVHARIRQAQVSAQAGA